MYNIICVKYGDTYNYDHVNKLYKMVKRNLSLPFSFYCLTENPNGINPDIIISPINEEYQLESYWWKFCIFQPEIYQQNVITLYLDLDTLIFTSLDRLLLEADPNKLSIPFIGVADDGQKWLNGVNSSIMIFNPENMKHIWQEFYQDPDYHMLEYFGVCRYLWNRNKDDLKFLKWNKDWTSFLKRYAINYQKETFSDGKVLKFSERYSALTFHNTNVPICILAGASRDGVLEDILKYFSSYYK